MNRSSIWVLLFTSLFFLVLGGVKVVAQSPAVPGVHTYDGKWNLQHIAVTAVYFVPRGRTPLPDWQERVEYFARRLEAFHAREFYGQSKLTVTALPQPVRSTKSPEELRTGDQNAIFWETMQDIRATLKWPPPQRGAAFPILLVLSDINWRELDDFHRERMVKGNPVHEGYVAGNGRHFPGAESGGARAVYLPEEGVGEGLVSADGWRVPYSGSDCVVYHEGVGHAVGLPHPEPMDNSVMGTAQYSFWLHQARMNSQQQIKLGVKAPDVEPERSRNLFTTFTALPEPLVPVVGTPVVLKCVWPAGASVRTLRVQVQTELFGSWKTIPIPARELPKTISLGVFPTPTPVSYRIYVTLKDGQSDALWGYFQVNAAP